MLTQLSPTPILEAFERFEGCFIDLDRGVTLDGDILRTARDRLFATLQAVEPLSGKRVIFAVGNGPLFPIALVTLLHSGACPILLHCDSPQAELQRIAERWQAGRLLTDNPRLLADAATRHIDLGEAGRLGWRRVAGVAEANDDSAPLTGTPLHLTSGTTGISKLAVRPGPCAIAEAAHYTHTLSIEAQDKLLCAVPMSHAYGYGMCIMVPLLTSAEVLTMRSFNPRRVSRALRENSVTIFPAVPAMLDLMLHENMARPQSLRLLLSAGAPLSRHTAARYLREVGIAVQPLYGTTETGGISVAVSTFVEGSVGPAMAGVELAIDTVEALKDDTGIGVLKVRSASMMAGYKADDSIDRGAIADGWFATDDLGTLDASGNIHLMGRSSDVINIFGHKVLPAEVEEVIFALPEVAEVKVYAGRHKSGSDTVLAAVVTHGEIDAQKIRKHCEIYLVAFKCPSRITLLPALPRTPSGKVILRRLPGAKASEGDVAAKMPNGGPSGAR